MTERRFLLVDADAAADLVSERTLQSVEFEGGLALGDALAGAAFPDRLTLQTHVVQTESGLYILHAKSPHRDLLVFDLGEARVFEGCTARDALVRFQKVLRFARRRWTKVSPAQNEMLFSGSTKAVVFPYPITAQTQIRITVELSPDKKRREARASGMELLVFRIGTDEGGGPNEIAPTTNFRRALEGLAQAAAAVALVPAGVCAPVEAVSSLAVTRLGDGEVRTAISGCTAKQWGDYLTQTQGAFISVPLSGPHRIEGPAGTGKTLSLVLKCISEIRRAERESRPYRALFVAHSEATRKTIATMFEPELGASVGGPGASLVAQSVNVTTLQSLCSSLLRYEISDVEMIDRDAFESKQSQLLYCVESIQEAIRNELETHRRHMSVGFVEFVSATDEWVLAELLQHEISVMIKGRASEDLDKYKRLPRLAYGLPVENEGDKAFVFLVFGAYQRRLRDSGQFDTDDVVLSALSQLDTPIWRRRREKEGYDGIFVDETHLFNINELSIFHRLTRTDAAFPIAYSVDVSQSLGDRGWSDVDFSAALLGHPDVPAPQTSGSTKLTSIFRCSPDIVNLAFSVTSSGATLFTNFHDPLAAAASAFTDDEERKCASPEYVFFANDEMMIEKSFVLADEMASAMQANRGEVAIVAFGNELFAEMERLARAANKPVEVLKHRGDIEVLRRAKQSRRFVLSTPDFVGGLEFDGVILIGVDKGRVPPRLSAESEGGENFLSYATHQRLYVAITRARYRVVIAGIKARGPSQILASALASGALSQRDFS